MLFFICSCPYVTDSKVFIFKLCISDASFPISRPGLAETKIAVHGNFPLSYEDKNQESVTYSQMQIKNNTGRFVCLYSRYAKIKVPSLHLAASLRLAITANGVLHIFVT